MSAISQAAVPSVPTTVFQFPKCQWPVYDFVDPDDHEMILEVFSAVVQQAM